MAKIDKKKPTHKVNAPSRSAKPAPKASARPMVINKGPKKKLELKKKELKPAGKFDKSHKPAVKAAVNNKPKGFNNNGKKFELKKPSGVVTGLKGPKKEIKIEQSSKQEYLKKKELKKKEQEKSQQLRGKPGKDQGKEAGKDSGKDKVELNAKGKTTATATKANANAKGKNKKPKEDNELDDVFIDDVGSNEIEEYEDELKAVEELDNETDDDILIEADSKEKKYEDVELTDAEGNKLCRSRDCDQIAAVDGYCRYHYLLFWKNIQVRKKILTDGKLGKYIEELTSRYPDKFLEMIRRDLRTQKDFMSAIQELEIDESNQDQDFEEDTQSFIDEVRGVNEGSSIEEEFE